MNNRALAAVVAAAAMLVWPAVWNGYPLLFADSGTYVMQVPTGAIGWDRPPFYSAALLLAGGGRSLWPAVLGQAVLAALLLRRAVRVVAPGGTEARFLAVVAVLAVGSALPWTASQVMPDLATGLLVLTIGLSAAPEPTRGARLGVALAATGLILLHLSHLLLAAALALVMLAWRLRAGGRRSRPRELRWAAVALGAPPALAAGVLLAVNWAAHGQASVAPFGPVFLLARLIEDGPARAVLDEACPAAAPGGWALCAGRAALPATADDILWSATSPLLAAERTLGPPRMAAEAGAIVARAWTTRPGAVLAGAAAAGWRQLGLFATGDGLNPWPELRDKLARVLPPAELARYDAARQAAGRLAVPPWLGWLHLGAALAGAAGCAACLLAGAAAARPLALAALLALPLNALITGALSGPHARYQSRVMWPPLAVAVAAWPARLPWRRSLAMASA